MPIKKAEEKVYNKVSNSEIENYSSSIWDNNKISEAKIDSVKKSITIMMPPPNVTGSLHIGHALNMTLQDVIARYWRMKGKDVLWQPGTDHAGIATQMLVERKILREGITSRAELGRDDFLKKVWEWKKESGGTIVNQLKRLGASADWSRERFTLDEGLSEAVREVFVSLYKNNLIYRDKRLVNWDTKLETAISDLEVIQKDKKGYYWYFKYPILGTKKYIIVATTRPETLLGDTCVAVNPKDKRYKSLIGKKVLLPIVNREILIVADEYADPEKGTGAVKITPAHDFNDFQVGKRHNLEPINILNTNGTLNKNTPKAYQGLTILKARAKIIADMEELGLLDKIEDTIHAVPYGDRSDTVIEPFLTDQWFVDAKKLAGPAIESVKNGETKFVPKTWENTFFEWMNNIEPWCISRQLWWGHRIPAWYATDGTIFVGKTLEEVQIQAFSKYGKDIELKQDPDVLDTWFSSGLWPFSTLGWPNKSKDLIKYYPGNILVTGFDIIFFWVARMMMLGIYFMKKSPFKEVYVHALVRDSKGNKMSKSKGNVVNPLVLMDQYGTDTIRFSLTALATQGRDIKLAEDRIVGYRNFITKIHNASKFLEMNGCVLDKEFDIKMIQKPINLWIINLLYKTADNVSSEIESYRFNEAANSAYHFVWHNFCDWYLEIVKPVLSEINIEENKEIKNTTAFVFSKILAILHPIIPFNTEYLYSKVHNFGEMLSLMDWPDSNIEKIKLSKNNTEIEWTIKFISEIRSLRAMLNIPFKSLININYNSIDKKYLNIINSNIETLKSIAGVESFSFNANDYDNSAQILVDDATFNISLKGVIDINIELDRLNKDLSKLKDDISIIDVKLLNKNFIERAPKEVIEEQKSKKEGIKSLADRLQLAINRLDNKI
ncbi:valine--tRNA ligase [Alphaproteobacteria bacterium]|nr:valine--tRNA ligase [Alphaproteobacteria bacterium]